MLLSSSLGRIQPLNGQCIGGGRFVFNTNYDLVTLLQAGIATDLNVERRAEYIVLGGHSKGKNLGGVLRRYNALDRQILCINNELLNSILLRFSVEINSAVKNLNRLEMRFDSI
jgi:hypothetical protein